jgi:hypothetical protein
MRNCIPFTFWSFPTASTSTITSCTRPGRSKRSRTGQSLPSASWRPSCQWITWTPTPTEETRNLGSSKSFHLTQMTLSNGRFTFNRIKNTVHAFTSKKLDTFLHALISVLPKGEGSWYHGQLTDKSIRECFHRVKVRVDDCCC